MTQHLLFNGRRSDKTNIDQQLTSGVANLWHMRQSGSFEVVHCILVRDESLFADLPVIPIAFNNITWEITNYVK